MLAKNPRGHVANLRPFKKGENGGGGRKKRNRDVTLLAEKEAIPAFLEIVRISKDAEVEPRVRLEAAKYIVDRAVGKPSQALALGGPNNETVPIMVVIGGEAACEAENGDTKETIEVSVNTEPAALSSPASGAAYNGN